MTENCPFHAASWVHAVDVNGTFRAALWTHAQTQEGRGCSEYPFIEVAVLQTHCAAVPDMYCTVLYRRAHSSVKNL